jgi:tetratricopeptide (TPR) repeat protein
VIEKFPLSFGNGELFVDDYYIFSTSFAEILSRHIPTVKNIDFFGSEEDFLASHEEFTTISAYLEYFHSLKEGRSSYAVYKGIVLLAFAAAGGDIVVAVLTGADPLFLQKLSKNWLEDKVDLLEREFKLLKQARVDVQTGLLNIANLYSLLESGGSKNNLLVALVNLPSLSTSLNESIKYTYKCVLLLKAFIRGRSILHYLGHSTFALVLQQGEEKKASTLESNLVAYLKKAGCHRVRVGSSTPQLGEKVRRGDKIGLTLLDEAWTALHRASKRGPFSFCEYKHLAFPENQQLAPPESSVVRKIGRWIRGLESFSLILFRGDNEFSVATELVVPFVEKFKMISVGTDLYVLNTTDQRRDVEIWVSDLLAQVSDEEKSIHVSAGITCFPFADISESETLFSCKKALLHAAFFGPSSYAFFDHVTLNISGDVYFGDGDFTLAIKEYKRGLKCCGGDVNLYNSLGVTLAMMNRIREANESFKQALAIEQDNFMALYNIGLSKQSLNQKAEATAYLGRAFEVRDAGDVDPTLIDDLKLQLGILSCETGQYESSVTYLESWLEGEGDKGVVGRAYSYLGSSYYYLGNNRAAMKSLERALRFDGFDDRALNLLGRLYLQEKEGAEIALSLCQKSVEIDPDNIEYKLYLAEINVSIGNYDVSRELLKKCLRRKNIKPYAQLLMGEGYLKESLANRSEGWFVKVLEHHNIGAHLKQRAQLGLESSKSLSRK